MSRLRWQTAVLVVLLASLLVGSYLTPPALTAPEVVEELQTTTDPGLLGTSNSIGYRVAEIERHFHGWERWLGKLGAQTATDNATLDFFIGLHEYEG